MGPYKSPSLSELSFIFYKMGILWGSVDNCIENIFKMQEKILFYSILIFLKEKKKEIFIKHYCGPGTIVGAENIAMGVGEERQKMQPFQGWCYCGSPFTFWAFGFWSYFPNCQINLSPWKRQTDSWPDYSLGRNREGRMGEGLANPWSYSERTKIKRLSRLNLPSFSQTLINHLAILHTHLFIYCIFQKYF